MTATKSGKGGAGKTSAAPKPQKREAAKREVVEKAPELPTITLREREYQLPEALPPSMIFDIVEIEAAEGSNNPIPIFRLVRNLLGPQQFGMLRNDLEQSGEQEIGETLAEAVEAIFGVYGVTPGES